jgi:hypothetical protein
MRDIRCKHLSSLIPSFILFALLSLCVFSLQSRIEALDFDVEKAAEEELYQGSVDQLSTKSSV